MATRRGSGAAISGGCREPGRRRPGRGSVAAAPVRRRARARPSRRRRQSPDSRCRRRARSPRHGLPSGNSSASPVSAVITAPVEAPPKIASRSIRRRQPTTQSRSSARISRSGSTPQEIAVSSPAPRPGRRRGARLPPNRALPSASTATISVRAPISPRYCSQPAIVPVVLVATNSRSGSPPRNSTISRIVPRACDPGFDGFSYWFGHQAPGISSRSRATVAIRVESRSPSAGSGSVITSTSAP